MKTIGQFELKNGNVVSAKTDDGKFFVEEVNRDNVQQYTFDNYTDAMYAFIRILTGQDAVPCDKEFMGHIRGGIADELQDEAWEKGEESAIAYMNPAEIYAFRDKDRTEFNDMILNFEPRELYERYLHGYDLGFEDEILELIYYCYGIDLRNKGFGIRNTKRKVKEDE